MTPANQLGPKCLAKPVGYAIDGELGFIRWFQFSVFVDGDALEFQWLMKSDQVLGYENSKPQPDGTHTVWTVNHTDKPGKPVKWNPNYRKITITAKHGHGPIVNGKELSTEQFSRIIEALSNPEFPAETWEAIGEILK